MHDLSAANPSGEVRRLSAQSFNLDQCRRGFVPERQATRPRRARQPRCDGTRQGISRILGQKFLPRPVSHLVRILLLASRTRLGKQPLPGVLAVAGTSVLAFRKPDTVGDHSFQDIRMDCSKGRKIHRFVECGRGLSASPDDLDPVRDCRRPSRSLHGNASFHNGLILQPA
jgi:hypothetical protein